MTAEQWSVLFLMFVRITALVTVLPFFSWRGVPALAKIGFSAVLAYLLFLVQSPASQPLQDHFFLHILAAGSEVLFGLALGFAVMLIFAAIRIGGQLIDMQAGLMMSSIFDPQAGSHVTLFGQFYYLFAIVFYMSVNGHHMLFAALARSFDLVPPGGTVFQASLVPHFMHLFFQMFVIAFQLAAPVVMVLIFSDLALGLISKTVPQLHVFMVGMPLKAGVALFIIYIIFPYFAQVLETVFTQLHGNLFQIIGLM